MTPRCLTAILDRENVNEPTLEHGFDHRVDHSPDHTVELSVEMSVNQLASLAGQAPAGFHLDVSGPTLLWAASGAISFGPRSGRRSAHPIGGGARRTGRQGSRRAGGACVRLFHAALPGPRPDPRGCQHRAALRTNRLRSPEAARESSGCELACLGLPNRCFTRRFKAEDPGYDAGHRVELLPRWNATEVTCTTQLGSLPCEP